MKKNIFKFGAALTAAMMVFSATAALAFADEIEPAEETETVVTEVAEAPEAEEAAADAAEEDVEEVVVPLETEEITAEDVLKAEAEVEAAAVVPDVDQGSVIKIGEIKATVDDTYYTVSVPFTVENAPSQMSFFVYDITKITSGDQNNTVGYSAETPVGYINQYAGTASGTYTFKLAKTSYNEGSIIVAKIGGTDVAVPDAKSFSLANATHGGDDTTLGDVDANGVIDMTDAGLVMQFYLEKVTPTDDQKVRADVDKSVTIDMTDAGMIMRYYLNGSFE